MLPWRAGVEGIVAFTGHAVLALRDDVTDKRLGGLGVDGVGGAVHPRVVCELAGPDGWIDTLDALLVVTVDEAVGAGPELVERPDLADHFRTAFARYLREDLRVLGRLDLASRSVVVLGRGIAGLTELSFEIDPGERRTGAGRALVRAALTTVPAGELVLAAVTPGNAASVRCLLAAGFAPIGSVQVFTRGRRPPWEGVRP